MLRIETNIRNLSIIGAVLIALPLSACTNVGANYVPVVDGPTGARFQQDMAECRFLTEQRPYDNPQARTATIGLAILGGVLGATGNNGSVGNAALGAALGGGYGGSASAAATMRQKQSIIQRCMIGRGHRVVG